MQCNNPITLEGKTPSENLIVPCGKCLGCRIHRTAEWAMRLEHESAYWDKAAFVTWTYNTKNLPSNGSLEPFHLSAAIKLLRYHADRPLAHFSCGEYGDSEGRAHYHSILFGVSPNEHDLLEKAWPHGFVFTKMIIPERLRYVAGYCQKKLGDFAPRYIKAGLYPPFQRQSQGIGKRWAFSNEAQLRTTGVCYYNGAECAIPRYYIKKLEEAGRPIPLNEVQEKRRKSAIKADLDLAKRKRVRTGAELRAIKKDVRKEREIVLAKRNQLLGRNGL